MSHAPFYVILNYIYEEAKVHQGLQGQNNNNNNNNNNIYTNFRIPSLNDPLFSVIILKAKKYAALRQPYYFYAIYRSASTKFAYFSVTFLTQSFSAAFSSDKVATTEFCTTTMIIMTVGNYKGLQWH